METPKSSVWKIYASIKNSLKSDNNYAIVFKDFSDNLIVLDNTPS